MQNHWLHRANRSRLVIFFAGWGSSPAYFTHMSARDCDVWMFYDYRDARLPDDFEAVLAQYPRVEVVAWSFGVWMANRMCAHLDGRLAGALAINGTLNPIDDREGIPVAIFNGTLEGLSPRGVEKFNRRMVLDQAHTLHILQAALHRPFDAVHEELTCFAGLLTASENVIFTRALIGHHDRIFPATHQVAFWQERVDTLVTGVSHYVFFDYPLWDSFIQLIEDGH